MCLCKLFIKQITLQLQPFLTSLMSHRVGFIIGDEGGATNRKSLFLLLYITQVYL